MLVNPTEVKSFSQAKREAEKIINQLIKTQQIPGVAVSVTKRGYVLWQQGYGWADLEYKKPIQASKTLFRVASVSKPISAVALSKMQEHNDMDWNRSLYDYVPDFPKKDFDFNIKQLSGHLAGIRGYRSREVFSNASMTIEEGIGMFKDDPLEFEPGTKHAYNSFNWNLISLAMQNACGKPFQDIVRDEVLLPLQMNNTFPDTGERLAEQAIPYSKNGNTLSEASPVHNFYKLAGGGYLSTAVDVTKLGNAMLSHHFLSQTVQNEMLTPQCTNDNHETGYGMGWQVSNDWKGRPYFGHIGNGIGGYAWFYVYPQEEMVVTMLFNVSNPQIDDSIHRMIDFIMEGAKFNSFDAALPAWFEFEDYSKENKNPPM